MVEHSREGSETRAGVRSPFVRTSILTFGTNVAFATLSLVNVLVVSRVLGPTGRGDVAFLTAIAWFTSNLATFGVQEANVNIAGAEPKLRRSLATNSVLFALSFGLLAIAVIVLLIAVVPAVAGPSTEGLRWLTFGSLPVLILAVYLRFLIQADYGFGLTNTAMLVGPVANVDQAQIRAEPLTNSSRLGKHLLKARRECAGHGNLLVSGRIHHEPGQQCPASPIVRQMNASDV